MKLCDDMGLRIGGRPSQQPANKLWSDAGFELRLEYFMETAAG
jgi:hypothetical protein